MGFNREVTGFNGPGWGKAGWNIGATIQPPATLTAAVDDTSGGIELTASEVSGADSYNYSYALDGGAWQPLATGQTTSYTFTPTEAGEYSFAVTAVKGSTESAMTTLVPGSLFDDVPNEQGIALMAFYEATNGDAWTTSTNWLTDSTVGNWFGVTVSGGAVTAIDLSSNNLVGAAGTTLDDLTLTSLDLTGNTLTGKILIADPGDTLFATADGAAAFRSATYDLSGYTSHKFTFLDSSDNEAVAYGYQADGAETLGSELLVNGDMESGSPPAGWNVTNAILTASIERTGGSGSQSLRIERTGSGGYATQDFDSLVDDGYVCFTEGWFKCDGTNYLMWSMSESDGTYGTTTKISVTSTSWIKESQYFTKNDSCKIWQMGSWSTAGNHVYADDCSLKKLTALGTDALQLRDAATGTTRNLTSEDASFDPNDISIIEIEAL